MHHNMLHLRKLLFYRIVHTLCNAVRLPQRLIAVHSDLNINIDFVAKHTGMQKIHSQHAFLHRGTLFKRSLYFLLTGFIHHLVHSIHKDLISCLLNKNTDYQTCRRIQNRKPQPGAAHTDQRAHRRQGIGAVVPCVRHERPGINPLRMDPCVLIQAFFHKNRYHCRHKGQPSGHSQIRIIPSCDLPHRRVSDPQSCSRKNRRQNDGCDTLHSLMAVRMVLIRRSARYPHSDDHYNGTEYIRGRVDRIRYHSPRMRKDSGQKLEYCQRKIRCDTDHRYLHSHLFIILHSFPISPVRCHHLSILSHSLFIFCQRPLLTQASI